MPFKERTRQYWINVAGEKCLYEQYSEKNGFQECGKNARHVHHIEPESKILFDGGDPEHTVGLPLCEQHHSRNTGEVLGDEDSSFHPEMGHAYKGYRDWKHNAQHMASIQGRATVDYSTSPFADAAKEYQDRVRNGGRPCNGDDGTDAYYTDKMRRKQMEHKLKTGESPPDTSPHPRSKKKHWYDGLFGGDDDS